MIVDVVDSIKGEPTINKGIQSTNTTFKITALNTFPLKLFEYHLSQRKPVSLTVKILIHNDIIFLQLKIIL